MTNAPIMMTEEYWANSYFSVARYTGSVKINGHTYTIVGKEGLTIFELSRLADLKGKDKAIEPGEPADLVRNDWIPLYRAVGRDRFMQIVSETDDLDKAFEIAGIEKRKRNPLKRK